MKMNSTNKCKMFPYNENELPNGVRAKSSAPANVKLEIVSSSKSSSERAHQQPPPATLTSSTVEPPVDEAPFAEQPTGPYWTREQIQAHLTAMSVNISTPMIWGTPWALGLKPNLCVPLHIPRPIEFKFRMVEYNIPNWFSPGGSSEPQEVRSLINRWVVTQLFWYAIRRVQPGFLNYWIKIFEDAKWNDSNVLCPVCGAVAHSRQRTAVYTCSVCGAKARGVYRSDAKKVFIDSIVPTDQGVQLYVGSEIRLVESDPPVTTEDYYMLQEVILLHETRLSFLLSLLRLLRPTLERYIHYAADDPRCGLCGLGVKFAQDDRCTYCGSSSGTPIDAKPSRDLGNWKAKNLTLRPNKRGRTTLEGDYE